MEKVKRILVVGDVSLDSRELSQVESLKSLQLRFEFTRGKFSQLQASRFALDFDLIVVSEAAIAKEADLLALSCGTPFLLITSLPALTPQYQVWVQQPHFRVLFEPMDSGALAKYIAHIFSHGMPDQQFAARFLTDLSALAERMVDGEVLEMDLVDVSRLGAKLTSASEVPIKPGEVIQLTVRLPSLKKEHTVSSEVIWHDRSEESSKLGVVFLSPKELLKKLMGA